MGNAKSKEEIVINQASNGDARGQISTELGLSEWLLIALVAAAVMIAAVWAYKRCQGSLRKTIRREINKHELSKSRDLLEREGAV